MKEHTPLMKQYYEMKAKYPNTILLFRMGDFFETFDDDAAITAKICGITLTKRNNGAAGAQPLAGFPHHQLDSYLPKLVKAGCRVAVCEQIEDPKKKTGLIVKRDVIEVVTPGVSLYDKLLDSHRNNYIVSLYLQENRNKPPRLQASTPPQAGNCGTSVDGRDNDSSPPFEGQANPAPTQLNNRRGEVRSPFDNNNNTVAGITVCDISTGEFIVGEIHQNQILQTIENYAPSEILYSKNQKKEIENILEKSPHKPVQTKIEDWIFEESFSKELLLRQFQTKNFKGFGIDNMKIGISAAGAILHYIAETQKAVLPQIHSIRLLNLSDSMMLDYPTRRNLEILQTMEGEQHGSLIKLLDKTLTPPGARLLRRWVNQPLNSLEKIHDRQSSVEFFVENPKILEQLNSLLHNFGDLERLISRISSGKATTRDVVSLAYGLEKLPKIIELLNTIKN